MNEETDKQKLVDALFAAADKMNNVQVGERFVCVNGEWIKVPPGTHADQTAYAFYITGVGKPTVSVKRDGK